MGDNVQVEEEEEVVEVMTAGPQPHVVIAGGQPFQEALDSLFQLGIDRRRRLRLRTAKFLSTRYQRRLGVV